VSRHPKTRVLFVCLGNSCRSQMAEGFARTYGQDVLEAASAGLAPAPIVAPDTIRVMAEKNIDLGAQFPKSLAELAAQPFDLIVNMSGFQLPYGVTSPERDWEVADPMGEDLETYCQVRDEIERLVMGLILELRRNRKS
jgi:arsenate reductase (thioredoxin)